ncbi:MAG: single-stranded DNA-binding protein [Bacteroidia bacterium]
MSGSVNKVILIGNLGKDPEVRNLESGVSVASFSLATSESYTNKSGERVNNTEWHNVVLWRGLADVAAKYLKKGSKIYVEGKLRSRSWQDQEGNTRYTTEVIADNMTMLDKASGDGSSSGAQQSSAQSPEVNLPQNETDDLPF